MLTRSRAALGVTALIAVGALSLSACSSSGNSGDTSGNSGDKLASTTAASGASALHNQLPGAIKSSGKVIVGVNVPYAPNEYVDDSGKVVGFDVDLLDATLKVLGVSADYRQEANFDSIVPKVSSGTYDLGMSSFTDTKEREATDDFVDYLTFGEQWAAPIGKTVEPTNACGLTVSVQSGTTELDTLNSLSKKCTEAGKAKIKIKSFDSQDDATNALVLGTVDAMTADSPITAYAVSLNKDKIQLAGGLANTAQYGWAVAKGSALTDVLKQALQQIIDDGTYASVLQKWGLTSGAIKTATINGAQS